ncbi:hypothetical protein MFM001_17680 [Mycobacterium sp. MFM001]|uniref:hypothetical protein n=1 Tax=Mycobacterium sp. MFM001 TaxID=2049453 RepID=UPI000DA4D259|nr:hypothetical protein [Mycobacterium sp. MFM001]GBE65306.1 hypothetical protein MFM001_17680 [Mycobacterium sp. MFM001]
MRCAIAVVALAVIGAATVLCPPAAADKPLPACAQTATVINPKTQLAHQDCRLHSGDGKGMDFDVRYFNLPEAPGPLAVKVIATAPSGEVVQTINELIEPSSPSPVGLQDLDGDGRDELIIPMAQHPYNGSPNTRFSVWRADGERVHFERTQMEGQAVYPSGDGYLVVNGGALISRDLWFYLPTPAGYSLVTVVTIEAEQLEPGTNRVLTASCRMHKEQGLGMVDMLAGPNYLGSGQLPVPEAEATFCDSPAAKAIWPHAERVAICSPPEGGNPPVCSPGRVQ